MKAKGEDPKDLLGNGGRHKGVLKSLELVDELGECLKI